MSQLLRVPCRTREGARQGRVMSLACTHGGDKAEEHTRESCTQILCDEAMKTIQDSVREQFTVLSLPCGLRRTLRCSGSVPSPLPAEHFGMYSGTSQAKEQGIYQSSHLTLQPRFGDLRLNGSALTHAVVLKAPFIEKEP